MERRPLKSRSTGWARTTARLMARCGITPNQVSVLSMAGAAISCGAFAASQLAAKPQPLYWVLGAVGIQFRLLCNLIDGMVAVEHDKKTVTGDLFNDVPDRISDALIIGGAAYAVADHPYAMTLGWVAIVLAVLSAYIRLLGGALRTPQFFLGPMAKPHRMALLTGAALVDAVQAAIYGRLSAAPGLYVALWILVGGTAVTCIRRLAAISRALHTTAESRQ